MNATAWKPGQSIQFTATITGVCTIEKGNRAIYLGNSQARIVDGPSAGHLVTFWTYREGEVVVKVSVFCKNEACLRVGTFVENGEWWCMEHRPHWALLERKAAAYDRIAAVWNDEHITEAVSVRQTFAIIKQVEES